MRSLTLALAVLLAPAVAQAQARSQVQVPARAADSARTTPVPADVPADVRGLTPGQRIHVRAFLGDCHHALAVYGNVAARAGDTMTVDLEPRGTTRPGDQLAIPIATIHSLHLSMGKPAPRRGFSLARLTGSGERWVEVKRPAGMRLERSCLTPVPSAYPGMAH